VFTGIVEELGTIKGIEVNGLNPSIEVLATEILSDIKIGDSISVNGVCLTVISYKKDSFKVEVMPETLRKTGLAELKRGHKVNLERALSLKDRLGGHIVTGHIDGVGKIIKKYMEANAVVLEIDAPSEVLKYVIPKGSIAIDGISLTVVEVKQGSFTVSLIPHTAGITTLGLKIIGDKLNLEGDLIGKYVEKFISVQKHGENSGNISMKDLLENGFI